MKKSIFLIASLGLFLLSFGTMQAQSNPTSFVVHSKSEVRASMAYMLNSTPTSALTLKFVNSNNQMVREFTISAGSQSVNKIDVGSIPTGNYTVELYNQATLIHKETEVQIINN